MAWSGFPQHGVRAWEVTNAGSIETLALWDMTAELALPGAARASCTRSLGTACPSASLCLAKPHTALFQEHTLLLGTLELTPAVPELTSLQPSAPDFFFFFNQTINFVWFP